ncbi:hypothetical protein [Hydrocoleum sp. CS-953]|uniref:hypothetical protein n=1 Tax=Hydrocoleum sp. CS-953 TaxID=1671698 RepID=UPI00117AB990|nr:hypothetical protein [Hydrocoleum sp. CS-953]
MSISVRTFPIMNNNSTNKFKVKLLLKFFSGKYERESKESDRVAVRSTIAFFQLSVISYQLLIVELSVFPD